MSKFKPISLLNTEGTHFQSLPTDHCRNLTFRACPSTPPTKYNRQQSTSQPNIIDLHILIKTLFTVILLLYTMQFEFHYRNRKQQKNGLSSLLPSDLPHLFIEHTLKQALQFILILQNSLPFTETNPMQLIECQLSALPKEITSL